MKTIGLLIVGGLLLLIVVVTGTYMAPQDSLEKADAIIAVSGGDTTARAMEATKLYQQDWAPLLVFSGAAQDPISPSNAQVMRALAIDQGISPDVIIVDEQSANTKQNASQVAAIVKAFHYQRVILVTSPYHQRRAFLEFKERLGSEVRIINHSAPDEWTRWGWWRSARGWRFTMTELPKTLVTEVIR